jgi:histidine triad (HIT) family protein
MDECVFCPIAAGEIDTDLVALRTAQVFVIPALRQHPTNRGHALVLPVTHTRNLADASASVRDEIFAIAAQLTSAMPSLYGADGSIVFLNNTAPGDPLFHLHVHIVPRFLGDDFVMTRAAVAEVPRPERLHQAALMRQALNRRVPLALGRGIGFLGHRTRRIASATSAGGRLPSMIVAPRRR